MRNCNNEARSTWLLCTLNAHARSRGSCVRVATMVPLRVMFQVSGWIAAVVPLEKRMTGIFPAQSCSFHELLMRVMEWALA